MIGTQFWILWKRDRMKVSKAMELSALHLACATLVAFLLSHKCRRSEVVVRWGAFPMFNQETLVLVVDEELLVAKGA